MMTPCDWPLVHSGCECSALSELTPVNRQPIEDMAVEMLWAWTGRSLGVCETAVRPCRAECAQRSSTFWGPRGALSVSGSGWVPVLIAGEWFNLSCGACAGPSCSCSTPSALALRLPGPVESIVSIWMNGAELPASAYSLRDGVLYRVDGGFWPACNDEVDAVDTPDTLAWEVTYMKGTPVPASGQLAAGVLACELAKAACQDKTCNLPQRVQSVTRQGVSIGAVLDSFEDLREGRTGIWLIDSWVAAQNAPRISPPQVYSPDIARGAGRGTMIGLGRGRS